MRYDEDILFIAVTIVYIAVYKYLWQSQRGVQGATLGATPIINMLPFHFIFFV